MRKSREKKELGKIFIILFFDLTNIVFYIIQIKFIYIYVYCQEILTIKINQIGLFRPKNMHNKKNFFYYMFEKFEIQYNNKVYQPNT